MSLRNALKRAYRRLWREVAGGRRYESQLNGEIYTGSASIKMQVNGPTLLEPPLTGEFAFFEVVERRLFGRWLPREEKRLIAFLIDGMDPVSRLLMSTKMPPPMPAPRRKHA